MLYSMHDDSYQESGEDIAQFKQFWRKWTLSALNKIENC